MLRLSSLAVGVAALALAIVLGARDSASPSAAQVTDRLTAEVTPAGCGTIAAQTTSDTSTPATASEWTFPQGAYVRAVATANPGCAFVRFELVLGGSVVWTTSGNPFQFQLFAGLTTTVRANFSGTPTSTPTPTPTATGTPSPTPTPTPTATPAPATCTQTTLGVDPAANTGLAADCAALLAARATLAGTATLNWSADTAMTSWNGVTLSGTPSRVSAVSLSSSSLTGSIPTQLGSLAQLRTLTLSTNQLTGGIPQELGNLTRLTQLHLNGNQLTGSIPEQLGNLPNLTQLSLGSNQLSGAIPAEFGKLTNLTKLSLKQNQLTGDVPYELASVTSLTHLYLAGNTLTGCVPAALKDVANNDFGTLALPFCVQLTVTMIGAGSVSPAETTTRNVDTTVTLTATWAATTHTFGGWGGDCSGTAPTCVLTMDADKSVTATFTELTCENGTAVANPSVNAGLVQDCERLLALRDALAGTATLNWAPGTAMTSWTGLTIAGTPQRVTKLGLASQGLTGVILGWLGDLTALTELRLNGNRLSGRLPSKLGQLTNLTHLYISGNIFTGCLPSAWESVSNSDLSPLSPTYCDPPTDVSFAYPVVLEGGNTYLWRMNSRTTPIIFDVPPGLRFHGIDLVVGTGIGHLMMFESVNDDSWIAIDHDTGVEHSRHLGARPASGRAASTTTRTPTGSAAETRSSAFDQLAASLWFRP